MSKTGTRRPKASKPATYTVDTLLGVKVKLAIGQREIIARTVTYRLPSYSVIDDSFVAAVTASFKMYEIILPDTRLSKDHTPGTVLIYIDPTGLVTQVSRA